MWAIVVEHLIDRRSDHHGERCQLLTLEYGTETRIGILILVKDIAEQTLSHNNLTSSI